MASYEFLTTWVLDAPREDVYDAIWDSAAWAEWWPGVVEATETDPGTPCGIGRRGRFTWRSRIPYPVRFAVVSTEVERPHLLAGTTSGDLEGTGRWRFFEADGATAAIYEWEVRTATPWMNAAGTLARPIFRWNHDQVMRRGGDGLARRLGCRLLTSS